MPGPYAQALKDVWQAGRFHTALLSLMLDWRGLKRQHDQGDNDLTFMKWRDFEFMSSCHPNSCAFMNIVSNANFANDVDPDQNLRGDAAAAAVQTGLHAIDQGDCAIWVQYGGGEGHSFTLVFSGNEVESFEGWAGGQGMGGHVHPCSFYKCILERADRLTAGGRPTRAEARTHLENLIDPVRAVRKRAAERLARAGYTGFDHEPKDVDKVPNIGIRTAALKTVDAVRTEVRTRMLEVGYFIQRAREFQRGAQPQAIRMGGFAVCCHCQAEVANTVANQNKWRACPRCNRHYCDQCKQLMPYLPRPGWFQDRQRPCDGPVVPQPMFTEAGNPTRGPATLPACGGVTALM